jgi:LCP family protein required for cell wall assembly
VPRNVAQKLEWKNLKDHALALGSQDNAPQPRGRRRILVVSIILTLVILLVAIGALTTGLFAWRHVNRVHIGTPITSSSGSPASTAAPVPEGVISVLIASVGARGVSPAIGKKIGVPDIKSRGSDGLTDLLMEGLVNTTTGSVSLLSIPRDTWIDSCQCKINALYNTYGATGLVNEIANLTGNRPQHLLLVSFEAFANVIDAINGVNVYLPRTIRDAEAHLARLDAGCQHLDGVEALAYIRSRHTQSLYNGYWNSDGSASDFGRIQRQHQVLNSMANRILSPSLPFHLPALIKAAGNGITIDDTLGLMDAVAIAKAVAGASQHQLHGYTIPSRFGHVGAASVVFTQVDQVPAVVTQWELSAQMAVPVGPTVAPTHNGTDGLTASGAWTPNTPAPTPNPAIAACINS